MSLIFPSSSIALSLSSSTYLRSLYSPSSTSALLWGFLIRSPLRCVFVFVAFDIVSHAQVKDTSKFLRVTTVGGKENGCTTRISPVVVLRVLARIVRLASWLGSPLVSETSSTPGLLLAGMAALVNPHDSLQRLYSTSPHLSPPPRLFVPARALIDRCCCCSV